MNNDPQPIHPAAHSAARKTFIARDGVHLQRGYMYLPRHIWDALDDLTERYTLGNASQTVAKLVTALAEEHEHSAQDDDEPSRP
jgi:hypothetical protein